MAYINPFAPAMTAPHTTTVPTQQLPPAPPSKSGKRPSVWDKEHISETLAGIAQAFGSSQNFSEGLGNAAGSLGAGQRAIHAEGQKSTTYGGPDNQFEITTDAYGNREVRQVPEFAAAVKAKQDARLAPNPTVAADLRARALYNIQKLPVEQREAAYNDLRTNPKAYGINTEGLPDTWSDRYAAVAGGMGMNVTQAEADERNDRKADSSIAAAAARTGQGAQRVAQGEARLGLSREAAKTRLRKSPPGTRRSSAKLPAGFILD